MNQMEGSPQGFVSIVSSFKPQTQDINPSRCFVPLQTHLSTLQPETGPNTNPKGTNEHHKDQPLLARASTNTPSLTLKFRLPRRNIPMSLFHSR